MAGQVCTAKLCLTRLQPTQIFFIAPSMPVCACGRTLWYRGFITMAKTLVFVRHGFSEWNAKNLFTGWHDVNLTERGVEEAKQAGRKIKAAGLEFDVAFTSVLTRAIKTCNLILEESNQLFVPQFKHWRLNERHYGALQGLDKAETAAKYGDEQVKVWRRSYDVPPPAMDPNAEGSAHKDRRYQHLDPSVVPNCESLELTLKRALPFWEDRIAPALRQGNTVIVVAHGNSLRALAKHIEGISDADILNLEIPTGEPIVYTLNDDLSFVSKKYLD